MALFYKWLDTPVGKLKLVASDDGLSGIFWPDEVRSWKHLSEMGEATDHPVLVETERQLKEYFAGKRTEFTVKLAFEGTVFQKAVWAALLDIPYGETRSYGDIARQVGNPNAVRAVGAAAGMNPIPIIAPCHRVIGASGKLTGFAGGLEVKELLLDLEGFPVLLGSRHPSATVATAA